MIPCQGGYLSAKLIRGLTGTPTPQRKRARKDTKPPAISELGHIDLSKRNDG